jgi:uncharacterized protein (DUF342 family)
MDIATLLDHRLGMLAVKKGVITADAFREALYEQRHDAGDGKVSRTIGDILVARGIITEAQRDAVLTPRTSPEASAATTPEGPDRHASSAENTPTGTDGRGSDEALIADDAPSAFDRPDEKVQLTYSDNWMTVYITPQTENWSSLDLEDIKSLAASEGIRYGMVPDDQISAYVQQDEMPADPLTLAQGEKPLPGEPDEIKYFFETDPHKIGRLSKDGTMDWKDRGQIPHVAPETLLAEIIPGKEGQTGIDVFGKTVLPPRVNMVKLSCGKGVKKSSDGLKFFATADGQPQIASDGALHVLPTLTIEGNIGIETGHVQFDGHIQVKGSVEKGYRVEGESLTANEILHANVTVTGDVIVQAGIYGSQIKTGGRLKAHHINQSEIVATGDIVVKKEVVESRVETNSRFTVDGGTVLASEIAARKGVKAGDIGSEAAKPSTLVVGVDLKSRRDIEKLREKIASQESRRKKLESDIAAFKQTADEVNTELGEVAQVQDRRMVRKRELEDKLRSVADDDDRKITENARQAVVDLEAEIKEIDQKVERLLMQDEELTEQIETSESRCVEIDQELEALRHKIREILDLTEIDKGLPVVKFSGTLYPRNQIKGPHATLVVKERVNKGVVREYYDDDPEARRPWQMSIARR